jgi:glycosyltransferase involved in cell wall biosynthesis
MRIGLVTGEFPPMQGGVGAYTHELATALGKLDHQVHVITRAGCASTIDQMRPTNGVESATRGQEPTARISVHPIVPHWNWRSMRRVMQLARRLDLEVLNIQYQAAAYDLHPAVNLYPSLSGLSSPRRKRQPPITVTFHDLLVPYLFPKAGPLRDWIVTFFARRADAVIVTNRSDELTLSARGVAPLARIPIGSNIAPVLPDAYDRKAWRDELGVTPEIFLLGFFGFFNVRKGVETLLRALAELPANYHLLFIGGTVGSSDPTNRAYADRILGLMEALGLGDRVHFTGYVSETEVSAAFAALDLCVLPYADGISFHHGTLMAALAHGQPTLSTQPSIQLPELVHGENVWLVPPQDPAALVAAVNTLAADPALRAGLADGAAELSTQFGWERIATRTADLLEGVIRET